MDKKVDHKYNIWKADMHCNPIEGTDRYYWGPSLRWVMKHIASKNNVTTYKEGDLIVRLPNGECYCGTLIH